LATIYGMDGPGIESRLGREVLAHPSWPYGLLILLYDGYRIFIQTAKRPERGVDGPGIESRWGREVLVRPSWPYGLLILLYDGYRIFIQTAKRPERGVDHPRPL